MKKLSYSQINNVMGKELSPIQRKFLRSPKMSKPNTFTHGNKPNNNDACPCGSGMKFKKCCKITRS